MKEVTEQVLDLINERIALDKKLLKGNQLSPRIAIAVGQDLEVQKWAFKVLSDTEKPAGFDDLLPPDFKDLVVQSNDYWLKGLIASGYDVEPLDTALALRSGMSSHLLSALNRVIGR